MNQLIWKILLICLAALSLLRGDQNYLLPNLQLMLIPPVVKDASAFSFMGEFGAENLRGSGTYGFYIGSCQRFKISGEFLSQKLKYDFGNDHFKRWVSQYAIGAKYQYLLSNLLLETIDVGGNYSHAFSRSLGESYGRIAGSDGGFGYLGATARLWQCASLSGSLNYDYLTYHRKFQSDKVAHGFGGTVHFLQLLPMDFALKFDSEVRAPFNFYQGTVNWNHFYPDWGINCGLYVNYTDGKKGLPNVLAGGIQLGFSFGPNKERCCKSKKSETKNNCYSRNYCSLANWVSTPAVYMPVVLAIADPVVCTSADAPTSTAIPLYILGPFDPVPFAVSVSSYFSSKAPLTYSAQNLPAGASIDPATGTVTFTIANGGIITITATNKCGSTSQELIVATIL